MHNWSGNLTYTTDHLITPASLADLQKQGPAKILGTRHCFNDIADAPDRLISLESIPPDIQLSKDRKTVTAGAGIRYGQLAAFLQDQGLALHNLASLPHISVAGACATATHGSGLKNGNLATAVRGMELIKADGTLMSVSTETEDFEGMPVHLGALGMITRITLAVEPTFDIQQDVFEGLAFGELEGRFEEIMGAGYSVSLFTDWQGGRFSSVWVKRKAAGAIAMGLWDGLIAMGASPARANLHPIPGISAEHCTEQMGVPGPWHERLPHFKMGFTPSSGEELQSEYFFPLEYAYPAIKAVEKLKHLITPHLLISEVRTIAADGLWMSPCYQRPSAAIHFTWKRDWDSVREVLPGIEAALEPFEARPHWGKLFVQKPKGYPMGEAFKKLAKRLDPGGRFRNAFLDRYL